jgi:hypothetical protein
MYLSLMLKSRPLIRAHRPVCLAAPCSGSRLPCRPRLMQLSMEMKCMSLPSDASPQEDEDEGNTMVRLDADSREGIGQRDVFGPFAILLVGFMKDEYLKVLELMVAMEAVDVSVIPCSRSLIKGTLADALNSNGVEYEAPPLGTRRAVFLSGMYGSEVMEAIGAYREAGLPPAVFGAFVPNNASRIVSDLVQEISAEDAAMKKKMQQRQ